MKKNHNCFNEKNVKKYEIDSDSANHISLITAKNIFII